MDNRREARIPRDKPVVLTILVEPERSLSARVRDTSPRGLGIESAESVPPGTPLQIEAEDDLYLGEVVHCRAMPHGWFLGVRFTEVLTGLGALANMVRTFDSYLYPAERSRPR